MQLVGAYKEGIGVCLIVKRYNRIRPEAKKRDRKWNGFIYRSGKLKERGLIRSGIKFWPVVKDCVKSQG